MFQLHRIMLNSRGGGVGCSSHQKYPDMIQAAHAAEERWQNDHMRAHVRWTVTDKTGRNVHSVDAKLWPAIQAERTRVA